MYKRGIHLTYTHIQQNNTHTISPVKVKRTLKVKTKKSLNGVSKSAVHVLFINASHIVAYDSVCNDFGMGFYFVLTATDDDDAEG